MFFNLCHIKNKLNNCLDCVLRKKKVNVEKIYAKWILLPMDLRKYMH